MNQGTCETCRWWDSEGCGIGYGFCRFNPPTAVFRGEEDGVDIYWPWTKKEDWCGQHTPKPLPATGEKGEGIVSKWPLMRDLPENEQGPFAKWLTGQTRPLIMDGDKIAEGNQDAYYPWDYDRWKSGLSILD